MADHEMDKCRDVDHIHFQSGISHSPQRCQGSGEVTDLADPTYHSTELGMLLPSSLSISRCLTRRYQSPPLGLSLLHSKSEGSCSRRCFWPVHQLNSRRRTEEVRREAKATTESVGHAFIDISDTIKKPTEKINNGCDAISIHLP